MKHTINGELLTQIILDSFKLNGLLVSEGDQLVKDAGLTSARWKVLGALSNKTNRLTVPDIARTMGQSRQAVQRLANEMSADGLLETEINPNHQRAKLLRLTNKGQQAYQQAMQKQIPWVNSLSSEFEESELKSVASLIERFVNQLEN